MTTCNDMETLWQHTRQRLRDKGLLTGEHASLSLRCPDNTSFWFGGVDDAQPVLLHLHPDDMNAASMIHGTIYTNRPDVGAIAWGGGTYGPCLADVGGKLPQIFDEQARHIGPMPQALTHLDELESALRHKGNALLWQGLPLCMGATCSRLALNAELFEKCAKAYVLAVAAGGQVREVPWLVRHIANGRLFKDQKRAAQAYAQGRLPEESRGY